MSVCLKFSVADPSNNRIGAIIYILKGATASKEHHYMLNIPVHIYPHKIS
jgi:hypothetical protein